MYGDRKLSKGKWYSKVEPTDDMQMWQFVRDETFSVGILLYTLVS